MVASLPDCTIMPLMRSSTRTCILGVMNMREPGIFQAFSLTPKVWSSVMRCCLRASNTTYAVMSLVREAGYMGVSMSLAASTWLPALTSRSR